MTARRRSARAILDAYRARCAERGLDPATGEPRVFVWPAERQQPDGRAWWCDPTIFTDAGEAHSSTEREALANVAAQARRLANAPEPEALETRMAREFRQIVREVLSEERAALPLRELHARRGVTVEEVAGQRMEVPIKGVA